MRNRGGFFLHAPRELYALADYFLHEAAAVMRTGRRLCMRMSTRSVWWRSRSASTLQELPPPHRQGPAAPRSRSCRKPAVALIIGVDRLDYSKELPRRFNAYARPMRACSNALPPRTGR
jgi:trehalose 6-phosphate synthase